MADPFVAEIRVFPFNFAPRGWAFCSGQLMPLAQNTALFSLLGTTYGGDGKSTFALPDLQDRTPIGTGHGPGLSVIDLGQTGGSETVTLLQSEIPQHTHTLRASPDPAELAAPATGRSLAMGAPGTPYHAASGPTSVMSDQALVPAGGDQPHNNMPPSLALSFCIALQGVFPPRG